MFERNSSNLDENISYVAVDENEKLNGFILTKIWNDPFEINTYEDICWINLIYVTRQSRNHGIGSRLLEFVEKEVKKIGKKIICLGKDYLNYFY